jgi:hypothetical protein
VSYRLSIIRNPAGTYSLVGDIPRRLCSIRPATRADILGMNCFRSEADGELCALYTPTFVSEQEAVAFCESHGYSPDVPGSDPDDTIRQADRVPGHRPV